MRICHLVDLRNHGHSDYHSSMTYTEMVDDVIRYADEKHLEKFTLLGHSLGGRISLKLASKIPNRINGLIIIEAPPKNLFSFQKFNKINFDLIQAYIKETNIERMTRNDAVTSIKLYFKQYIKEADLLIYNLAFQQEHPQYVKWSSNMSIIFKFFHEILSTEIEEKYPKNDYVVIVGSNSFTYSSDIYKKVFPDITQKDIKVIQGAGHIVHADKPNSTINEIHNFLLKIDQIK